MKGIKIPLALLAVLTLSLAFTAPKAHTVAAAPKTRHVMTNGSDVNNNKCNLNKPCKTISHAVAVANPGDTIQLGAGTFQELLIIGKDLVLQGMGAGDTKIDGNKAGRLISAFANITIRDLTLKNGDAGSGAGGAILNSGTLKLKNVILTGNEASLGGALHNAGVLKVLNSTIAYNHADAYGAGIVNFAGKTVVKKSSLLWNSAQLNAAIVNSAGATLVVKSSTIAGNLAQAEPSQELLTSGKAILANVTITPLAILNNPKSAGGLTVDNDGSAELTNVTLVGYDANALRVLTGATAVLKNTILLGETHSPCAIFGTITDGGHNLANNSSCGLSPSKHNLIGNPQLGLLAANGGPTQTRALAATSPAIDKAAKKGCSPQDQRGVARPVDGDGNGKKRCDIGAFEFQP